ncbi:MAG: DUF924 family protein [Pseudomonadota bacterium]
MGAPYDSLLQFWFGDLQDGIADTPTRSRWFTPDATFDQQCTEAFGHWLEQARQGSLESWLDTARGRLAFILVCDQLPRNIHRGSSAAFAWDALALSTARDGIVTGQDRALGFDERAFFYMPFEHSEALLDQHMAVGLFTDLRDSAPKEARQLYGNTLRFAQQHRDIIKRFGRFPHRNAVLQRTSSEAEAAFVEAGDGFGQLP